MNPVKQYLGSLKKLDRFRESFKAHEMILYANIFNNFRKMYALLDLVKYEEFKEMTYELWDMMDGDLKLKFLRNQQTTLHIWKFDNGQKKFSDQWIIVVALPNDYNINCHLKSTLHQPSDQEIDDLLKENDITVVLTKYHYEQKTTDDNSN